MHTRDNLSESRCSPSVRPRAPRDAGQQNKKVCGTGRDGRKPLAGQDGTGLMWMGRGTGRDATSSFYVPRGVYTIN